MAPEVTVIVPVRNGQDSIRGCVESVLASRFPEEKMEVICIDNASTDGTLGVLRSFGSAIQLLQEPTRGAGAARNAGLRKAAGALVAFTDADCTVAPDWLANLVEPLRAGRAGAVGGRILARPQAGPIERFGELVHDHRKAIEDDCPPYIITMNLASRLDLLRSVGCFDERWIRMQDVDISYRLVAAGMRFAYCHEAVIYHHNRETIGKLMREGFIHGLYAAPFSKTHGNFMREYRAKTRANAKNPPARSAPNPGLTPLQLGLFWRLFNGAKKAGRLKGSLFPPVVIE